MKILDKIEIQRPPTIREEVFKYLRQKILTGEACPGAKLIESKLAEEIGASRTPVREALHKLEMENLIQSIPRVGYVVNDITEEEVEEIIEIRVAVETLAAKRASAKITSRELNRLERIIRLTEGRLKSDKTDGVADLNTEFHERICRASRSQRILAISQNLRDQMLRFRRIALREPEVAREANEGHRHILESIKSADMQAIEKAVHAHLVWTRDHIIHSVRLESAQSENSQ
jgi:DNA-binding GntR family transcriptional regulator